MTILTAAVITSWWTDGTYWIHNPRECCSSVAALSTTYSAGMLVLVYYTFMHTQYISVSKCTIRISMKPSHHVKYNAPLTSVRAGKPQLAPRMMGFLTDTSNLRQAGATLLCFARLLRARAKPHSSSITGSLVSDRQGGHGAPRVSCRGLQTAYRHSSTGMSAASREADASRKQQHPGSSLHCACSPRERIEGGIPHPPTRRLSLLAGLQGV